MRIDAGFLHLHESQSLKDHGLADIWCVLLTNFDEIELLSLLRVAK